MKTSVGKFENVLGYKIHYVDEGAGDPILFVHGNPTSSFIWRNVLPPVAKALNRRGIAIDLLGFGKSDKPRIPYSLPLHYKVLKQFAEQLELKNVALVLHDWGGAIGMRYAAECPEHICAVASMETFLWNMRFEDFPEKFKGTFKTMRGPAGFILLQLFNMADKMISGATLPTTQVAPEVLKTYRDAFPTISSRRAFREFTKMLLFNDKPLSSKNLLDETVARLSKLKAPVCLIRADPGTEYTDDFVLGLKRQLPQLESLNFGPGGHYLQEDDPARLSNLLIRWFRSKGI